VITLVELKTTTRSREGLKSRGRASVRRMASAVQNSVVKAGNLSEAGFSRLP
jgi:hypothetical protein